MTIPWWAIGLTLIWGPATIIGLILMILAVWDRACHHYTMWATRHHHPAEEDAIRRAHMILSDHPNK